MHQLSIVDDPVRRIGAKMLTEQYEWAMEIYSLLEQKSSIPLALDRLPSFQGTRHGKTFMKELKLTRSNLIVPIILVWAHEEIERFSTVAPLIETMTDRYLSGVTDAKEYDFTFLFDAMGHDYEWSDYFTGPTGAVLTSITEKTDLTELIAKVFGVGLDHLENTMRLTFIHSLMDLQGERGGMEYDVSLSRVDEVLDEEYERATTRPRVVNPYKGGGFSCIS